MKNPYTLNNDGLLAYNPGPSGPIISVILAVLTLVAVIAWEATFAF